MKRIILSSLFIVLGMFFATCLIAVAIISGVNYSNATEMLVLFCGIMLSCLFAICGVSYVMNKC